MTGFSIQTPAQIVFGRGMASRVANHIAAYGARGVLVHGGNAARSAWLTAALRSAGCEVLCIPCTQEPTLPMLNDALDASKPFAPLWVAAIGGGAVLDLGKAMAALIPSPSGAMDHLEVVGLGLPLTAAPLPYIALPTTSGTGAEATKNAVIGLPDHRRKVSLRDDRMLARLAIVDPALTDDCPWPVTLSSGLDAIVQLIEPYICKRANTYTDALVRAALPPAMDALQRLRGGEDATARDAMAWASLCGGLALANAGLGAVHGLAGPIGGASPAPHGAVCGALLGPVLAMNRTKAVGTAYTARIDEVCAMIAAAFGGQANDAPQTIATWARKAGLIGLTAQGLALGAHDEVASAALGSSSMKANPVALTQTDLITILAQAAP